MRIYQFRLHKAMVRLLVAGLVVAGAAVDGQMHPGMMPGMGMGMMGGMGMGMMGGMGMGGGMGMHGMYDVPLGQQLAVNAVSNSYSIPWTAPHGFQPPVDPSMGYNPRGLAPPQKLIKGCEYHSCKDAFGDWSYMLPTHGHNLKMFDTFKEQGVGYAKDFKQTGLYKTAPIAVPSMMLTKDGFQDGILHPAFDGVFKSPGSAYMAINTAAHAGIMGNQTIFQGINAPPGPSDKVAFQMPGNPYGQYWMTDASTQDKMHATVEQNKFYYGDNADIQDGTYALEQAIINRKKTDAWTSKALKYTIHTNLKQTLQHQKFEANALKEMLEPISTRVATAGKILGQVKDEILEDDQVG
jgi:hypothetical protein